MQAKTPDLSGSETLGLAGFALIIRRDQCRAQYIHTHRRIIRIKTTFPLKSVAALQSNLSDSTSAVLRPCQRLCPIHHNKMIE